MRVLRVLSIVAAALALTACSPSASDKPHLAPALLTAATLGGQVVLPTKDYLELPRFSHADAKKGRQLASQCRACHSFDTNGPDLSGPNLHQVFGRPVASLAGYSYSPALEAADFIWTPRALDAWLEEPSAFLPGSRMSFAGIRNADDRSAVIAALLRLTTGTTGSVTESGGQTPANKGEDVEPQG